LRMLRLLAFARRSPQPDCDVPRLRARRAQRQPHPGATRPPARPATHRALPLLGRPNRARLCRFPTSKEHAAPRPAGHGQSLGAHPWQPDRGAPGSGCRERAWLAACGLPRCSRLACPAAQHTPAGVRTITTYQ
jgi:hypothetical protein